MPNNHWNNKTLGDLFTLEYGLGLTEAARANEGFSVYGSSGVVGKHSDYLIEGPGIIVGRKGSVGSVFWSDESFWPIDTTYYVRPKDNDNLRWLYWCLSNLPLKKLDSSTSIPGLNRNDVYAISIECPNPDEQRRIAKILDTVDAAIRLTEALIAKHKQMRAGLLRHLLTRGIGKDGKLRDPQRHPEQFKYSPLGLIPKEWEVKHLGNLAKSITSGSRGWATYYSNEGAIFLRIGNLTREHINLRLDDVVRVQPPAGAEGQRTKVQAGDLLISITADLGIIGVIPEKFEEAFVNQHIGLVRIDSELADPRWVGNYLSGVNGRKQFSTEADTGAKAGLNLLTVASLLVACPTLQEQQKVTKIITAHDFQISLEETKHGKLIQLKRGLMRDLLTGRVRVNERKLEAVAR